MKIDKKKNTYNDYDVELSWGQLQAIKDALERDHADPVSDELYAELCWYFDHIPGPGEEKEDLQARDEANELTPEGGKGKSKGEGEGEGDDSEGDYPLPMPPGHDRAGGGGGAPAAGPDEPPTGEGEDSPGSHDMGGGPPTGEPSDGPPKEEAAFAESITLVPVPGDEEDHGLPAPPKD